MTDQNQALAAAFLAGFTGFAWTFAAAFWAIWALPPLAVLTLLTYQQLERAGWLSVRLSGSAVQRTDPETATDGGVSETDAAGGDKRQQSN